MKIPGTLFVLCWLQIGFDGLRQNALSQPFIYNLPGCTSLGGCQHWKQKGKKNFFYIHQSQGGNLADRCELRLINRSTLKRKSRGLLLTLVPQRSHLSNSYLPSVQSWHRPNSVSAHEASTSSGALSPPTLPAGKKDGHSAGWLSGPLCPPNIPQSPLPLFPPLTRGFAFHFPFDVSHSAAHLFLICVTEST